MPKKSREKKQKKRTSPSLSCNSGHFQSDSKTDEKIMRANQPSAENTLRYPSIMSSSLSFPASFTHFPQRKDHSFCTSPGKSCCYLCHEMKICHLLPPWFSSSAVQIFCKPHLSFTVINDRATIFRVIHQSPTFTFTIIGPSPSRSPSHIVNLSPLCPIIPIFETLNPHLLALLHLLLTKHQYHVHVPLSVFPSVCISI